MAAKKSRQTSTKFVREAKLRERRRAKEERRDARRKIPVESELGCREARLAGPEAGR